MKKLPVFLICFLLLVVGSTTAADCTTEEELSAAITDFYDGNQRGLKAFDVVDMIREYYQCIN